MRYFFLILISGVLIWFAAHTANSNAVAGKKKLGEGRELITIAHRGASGYAPENTFASFDKALKMKTDYIEFDIQRTSDGKLVIIHDQTVDRTTNGRGPVQNIAFNQLKKLDAGSWFSNDFINERIPSFQELLDRYAGKVKMLIELKNPSQYPGIEKEVAEVLKKYHLNNRPNDEIIIQSFDKRSVQTFHHLLPDVSTGVLLKYKPFGIPPRQLKEIAKYADFVNPNKSMANPQLVNRIHELGMKTTPYTINDRETASYMKSIGADGMVTNYPDYVKELNQGKRGQ
ncbi:glycerophosphodiester phosphodiesterase [Metabacillus sp. RGM 3146]|uniref:glycerophosphodiester phosphodiesterase n=1 Tax=Metabacillus sp. RGM 3146 TaxID=3401092 RepID=UPI003B9D30CA